MSDFDNWENEGGLSLPADLLTLDEVLEERRQLKENQLKLFDINEDGTIDYEPRE